MIYAESLKACLTFDDFKVFKTRDVTDFDLSSNKPHKGLPYLFNSSGKAKTAYYSVQKVLQTYFPDRYGWATDWKFTGPTLIKRSGGFTGKNAIILKSAGMAEQAVDVSSTYEAYMNFRWKADSTLTAPIPLQVVVYNEKGKVIRVKNVLRNKNTEGWQPCFVRLPYGPNPI